MNKQTSANNFIRKIQRNQLRSYCAKFRLNTQRYV